MAPRSAYVGSLFLVRWGVPTAEACAELQADFERELGDTPPFCIAVLPHDMPALKDAERKRLAALTEGLLPVCARVSVVIEARGFRGAILRRAVSALSLCAESGDRLKIVDSIDTALAWSPRPLPPAGALRRALEQTGCAIPPGVRVA